MPKFNPEQCKNVGKQLVEAGNAVSDGLQAKDMGEGMDVMAAIMGAADEFQTEKKAALLLVIAGACEEMAGQIVKGLPEAPALS